jgi:hypothetical protein
MKPKNMQRTFVLLIVSLINIFSQTAYAEHFSASQGKLSPAEDTDLRSNYLLICDSIVKRISDVNNKLDYFIDSYAVRGLCVAYDMTGKQAYLDACISWSKRMVEFQKKMIPAGVYYMHYERKPGEEKGDWFVADGSCIAMGVLTTAVRCKRAEKDSLLQSVEKFAALVMKNYLGPSGGVCNGGWSVSKDEWWCSSGLFGSLTFMLYETTGNQKYLDAGLGIVDWCSKQDLTKAKPFPLSEQGPSMPMYFLEAYSAGWPWLSVESERKKAAETKVKWCLDWVTNQQNIPVINRKWAPTEWWGSKFGGLPFHQFVFSKYLPEYANLKNNGDQELKKFTEIVISKKLFDAQITMFMMLAYAERLSPDNVYRMKK